jgi:NAD(P)-dependent dehydrogenase (short-subunit alcohol dehydrogenase family)
MSQGNEANAGARKVAVVTGGGTGIGAALTRRLARLGWDVVIGGRRGERLAEVARSLESEPGRVRAVAGDVTIGADVERLIDAAGPRLDALIHSAGIGHCLTLDEVDEEEWRRTLDVAVTGAFLTAKAALPRLRATRGGDGHIIQVGSLASGGTWFREVSYGTAKSAQVKFALHLASQLQEDAAKGGRVIHSVAVCPGTVDTPFWDRVPQRLIEPELCLTADEVAWMVERVILEPGSTAESLARIKPRPEIVVKRLAPYEKWNNVIAIAHESHP